MPVGSASRLTAAGFGFGVSKVVAGSRMSRALLGVGVAGGASALGFAARRRLGVAGAGVSSSGTPLTASSFGASDVGFLFRPLGTGAGGAGSTAIIVDFDSADAAALKRADLRVAMCAL